MTETGRRLTSVVLAALLVGGVMALMPSRANAAVGDITLFAGPSTITTAPFRPTGVSFANQASGTRVYFTDISNHQVDFFDTASPGSVVVAAGTGSPGAGADGVAGTSSALNTPTAVFAMATTAGGTTTYTVWVADTANNRVRRINPDGTITTVASGLGGPQGVTFAPGVGAGAGTLFVSDTNNNQIVQVASTGTVTQYITGLSSPRGLAVGESNKVYAVDQGIPGGGGGTAGEVLKFTCPPNGASCAATAPGITTVVAGGGFNNDDSKPGGLFAVGPGVCPSVANALQLSSPQSVSLDGTTPLPNVFVADAGNHEIHKVAQTAAPPSCANTSTDAAGSPGKAGFGGDGGSATPTSAATPLLNFPEGVAFTPTGFYVADTGNGRIRQVNGGNLSTVSVSGQGFVGDSGPATQAELDQPVGVAEDTTAGPAGGTAYIADALNNRIRKVSPSGTISTFAGTGQPGSSGDLGAATSAQLNDPSGVAVDPSGNVFIADTGSNKIREVRASDGTIVTVAGNGGPGTSGDGGPAIQAQLNQPRGVAVDGLGNLYIADTLSNEIRRVDLTNTQTITTFEKSSNSPQSAQNNGNIKQPWAVAVDSKNNVYWTDTGFNQVDSAPPAGGGSTLVAGNGTAGSGGDSGPAPAAQLNLPKGLAVDPSGIVYIADSGNSKVRSVSASVIKTTAGNGTAGYQGDGGPAATAELNGPTGLALTSAGDLLIGDTINSRVRKVQFQASTTPPTPPAPTPPPPPPTSGYWFVASDGGIFSFGDAKFFGSMGATPLNKPVVGMASTPTRSGYWLVASDGGIFSFGDAQFHGSTGNTKLNKPVVGMAPTPSGNGYWLVASDGGIFAFGDAVFFGSTGATPLNKPVVGMAASPSGNGYWLVASDGGIFAFGDAGFFGSTGNTKLNQPVVGMASIGSGKGYWFVASDGGIFSFGDAQFHGSTGNTKLNKPVVGMAGFQA